MKLKKLIISASAIAASSGLVATVLTSCSKADIDEDLKIELDSEGKFVDLGDGVAITYKDVIKSALGRSSTWSDFKQALANEIVYKWYENRASKDKNDSSKNTTFRSNLDEWKYQIDKDYDDVVDNCKSKYGANYKFYLQNEHLAPNGGTEEAYKHAKLVEKVKSKFVDDAFATIFFGHRTDTSSTLKYPQIFAKAESSVNVTELNNPAIWPNLGFFAQTSGSFKPGDKIDDADLNYLAKNPEGDYATLQQFVFDRWFKTEKPFFSAAALFKYSNPNTSDNKKLTDIYNGSLTTIPENPSEAFPYFGGQAKADTNKGTLAFYKWYQSLVEGGFETGGLYYDKDAKKWFPNGTTTIPSDLTEDSQTLLLCSGKNMIGGTDGALYIPYGISAASLWLQMILGAGSGSQYASYNTMDQADLEDNVLAGGVPTYQDDIRLLNNFMFNVKPSDGQYLDLNNLYGGEVYEAGVLVAYHCPIFNKNYKAFYGDDYEFGKRYIINNFQTLLGKYNEAKTGYVNTQPWVLELNEAGVHAQTIDGYQYVTRTGRTESTTEEALKNAVKYRLMQKKCGYNDKIISADLLDNNGKLKTYFNDNFADIILEMTLLGESSDANIFKTLDSYKAAETKAEDLFLNAIANEQHLESASKLLKTYLKDIVAFDVMKKKYDSVIAANEKIYAYRSTQIANAKDPKEIDSKIYENGLLAPIPLMYLPSDETEFNTKHFYPVTTVIFLNDDDDPTLSNLDDLLTEIRGENETSTTYISEVANAATKDTKDFGFNPQIAAAKDAMSNRYWYSSYIVDKMMYGYMGGNDVANAIKQDTYSKYIDKVKPVGTLAEDEGLLMGATSTYIASKLLSGDKNYATYGNKGDTGANFFNVMQTAFTNSMTEKGELDGDYCNELTDVAAYYTTLYYLARDDFKNLYSTLNNRIANDEAAFIGYITKYDTTNSTYAAGAKASVQAISNPAAKTYFGWKPNVDNIFDNTGYSGGTGQAAASANKISFDQYWHVVQTSASKTAQYALAGFTGLQTKRTNQLPDAGDLKGAAFDYLAKATVGSADLLSTGKTYAQNDGALFAWAGQKDASDKEYTFDEVTDPVSQGKISPTNFANIKQALKLAKSIANSSSIQDLRDIAKSLGSAIYGYSLYRDIGEGQFHFESDDPSKYVDELKYAMLEELCKVEGGTPAYKHMFVRVRNAELHGEVTEGTKYCFESGSNGYKLFLTQINKSDITEKRFAPTWDGAKWVMPTDSEGTIMDINEFWYIFCSLAAETSIQQLAIADAVKEIYGEDKLVVHDAQLYNQFDSIWIKDWVKKTIGE